MAFPLRGAPFRLLLALAPPADEEIDAKFTDGVLTLSEAKLQTPVRGIEVPPIDAIVEVSMVGGRESFGIYWYVWPTLDELHPKGPLANRHTSSDLRPSFLHTRIDYGFGRAFWSRFHGRWLLTLWAFSRCSTGTRINGTSWSLRLLLALCLRGDGSAGAVRRRRCRLGPIVGILGERRNAGQNHGNQSDDLPFHGGYPPILRLFN